MPTIGRRQCTRVIPDYPARTTNLMVGLVFEVMCGLGPKGSTSRLLCKMHSNGTLSLGYICHASYANAENVSLRVMCKQCAYISAKCIIRFVFFAI